MIYDEGRPKADDGLGVDEEDGVDATVVLGVVGHLNNISPCRIFIFIYIYVYSYKYIYISYLEKSRYPTTQKRE